jgi:hypothetical protein
MNAKNENEKWDILPLEEKKNEGKKETFNHVTNVVRKEATIGVCSLL